MPAFALRFVGQETLPFRLSEFDREQFFELSSADVTAIREEFRSDHRLPAALMLMFMRVAGRPLAGFTVLPRNLLRHTAQVLGVSPPSLASLRSIYKRRQTPSKHQLWAKTYLELRDVEPVDEALLTAALSAQAEDAAHTEDLVLSASHWLFTRRILIPGARRLQDWARDAFAAVEAQILAEVTGAVPPVAAQKLVDSAYRVRPTSDATYLEWLKTPSKRHGPSALAESVDKVRYLKELGAHAWDLSAVSLAKQQAYARQVQARRPVKTREIKPSRQLIELVCFLRVVLLELTDVALLQSGRRSQQLFREAADKAQAKRVRGTTGLPAALDGRQRHAQDGRGLEPLRDREAARQIEELLRLAASIRSGRVSATLALQRFGSAAQGDPLHRAAEHLGRLLRTVFLCDYIAIEDFRREIHSLLNRGESVHQLQRAVYSGKVAPERGRRRDEMRAISGSHALLTNIVLAWNTSRMHDVIERLKRDGTRIEDDWLRRIGPAHFAHINFRGTMRFGVEKYADSLVQPAGLRARVG